MTAQELIDHLGTFEPTAPVRFWMWSHAKGCGMTACVFVGCNQEHQHEEGVVTLMPAEGTWQDEPL